MAGARSPLIDRRDFLRAAGAGFAAAMAPAAWAATLDTDAIFATAFVRRGGGYGAGIFSEAGKLLYTVPLPDRGHDITYDAVSRRSVVFPRQPGTFAVVFDHARRTPPLTIAAAAGRHFYGHGAFSGDGKLLYATENDFDNAAGTIGIYDAADSFRRIGELPSHGTGPHEVLLLDDGRTLAVANGGIETHPDFGRAKLNVATMKPSYVLVDRLTGDLIEKHEPPPALHQLSIRHMDVDSTGVVWFGCQFQGATAERPPLIGKVTRSKGIELVGMPDKALNRLHNYIGAMAANRRAGTMAVSSPAGNTYVVFDTASGAVVSVNAMTEVCGIAPDRTGFIVSSGAGEIVGSAGRRISEPDYVWDNHILRIAAP